MTSPDPRRATIFGQYADDYERWRPTYFADAVDWLLPEGAARVADVGAGTGKLTGLLLRRGLSVAAVEPDAGMLDVLRRSHPAADAHLAAAESIPLPDASVDAVLAADAWHWVTPEAALREARRVLRPGGWLGLVWNSVAPLNAWEFDLARLDPDHEGSESDVVVEQEPTAPGLEGERVETATFPWTWEVSPDQWRSYLATHSGYAVMDPAERDRRLDAARDVVTAACEQLGRSTAPVRHEAVCFRWRPQTTPDHG